MFSDFPFLALFARIGVKISDLSENKFVWEGEEILAYTSSVNTSLFIALDTNSLINRKGQQIEDFLLCFLSHMILYIVVKQYLINTFLSLAVSPIYRVFQTLDTGPVSAEKLSQLFAWKSHITTTGGHRATSSKNSLFLSLNFLISGNYFSIEFEWSENALISVKEETLFCIPVKQRTEFRIS